MADTTSFGKRRQVRATAPSSKPMPAPEPIVAVEPDSRTEADLHPGLWDAVSSLPLLTFGLIGAFVLIYRGEDLPPLDLSAILKPVLSGMIAAGGVSRHAVFGNGEWWRLFTAPLMHENIIDLLSNAISLVIAGAIFESLIGRAWFGALFASSAIGGSLGCLVLNDVNTVSVGASGAVLGLLAAAFVCSFLFESEQLRERLRRRSLRLLLASLLPVAMPFLDGDLFKADYGAPIGGAIVGGLMGYLLLHIWPENADHPAGKPLALAIAVGSAVLSVAGFAFLAL